MSHSIPSLSPAWVTAEHAWMFHVRSLISFSYKCSITYNKEDIMQVQMWGVSFENIVTWCLLLRTIIIWPAATGPSSLISVWSALRHCGTTTRMWCIQCHLDVLLVGEDEDGYAGQQFLTQELVQVWLDFRYTGVISWVDDVDECVSLIVVISPVGSDLSLTTDIPNVQLESILRLLSQTAKVS